MATAAGADGGAASRPDALGKTLPLGLVFLALVLLAGNVAGLLLTALLLKAHAPDTVRQLLNIVITRGCGGLEGGGADGGGRHRHGRALVDLSVGLCNAEADAALSLLFLIALLVGPSLLPLASVSNGLLLVGAAPSVAVAGAGGRVAIMLGRRAGCGRDGLYYFDLDARSLHTLIALNPLIPRNPAIDNDGPAGEARARVAR